MSAVERIVTRVAHAGFDDHRFCGHGALKDLLGHETYTGLLTLALSGRRLDASEVALIDDLVAVVCAADPRIWPLKITRLVSSYGDMFAGLAAGQLCMSGSETIGPWVAAAAAQVLLDVDQEAKRTGKIDDAIAHVLRAKDRYPGWGVGFRHVDERLVALKDRLIQRGRTEQRWWLLYEQVSDAIRREKGIEPNVTAGAAAMLLDLGFNAHEAGLITTFAMQLCFVANAVEGSGLASRGLRQLPTSSVAYVGVAPRVSPRARAAEEIRKAPLSENRMRG